MVLSEMKNINNLSYKIIGCVCKIHSRPGPGLLESAYETCLEYELRLSGLDIERQKALPLVYDQINFDAGYRIDLIVNKTIILEIKAVEAITPIHKDQVMIYLKLWDISWDYCLISM